MLEPPRQQLPILALRSYKISLKYHYLISSDFVTDGAGVDIFTQDFWVKYLPKTEFSWMIVATGRTSWVENFFFQPQSWNRALILKTGA